MAQLREVKKRIKAVKNIQRITKTMQMIATAKFQAAIRRAQATKPYTTKLAEIVAELAQAAGAGGTIDHPLLAAPANRTGRELVLVITSNRGLAGAYNSNVLRTASALLKSSTGVQVDLEVVGKKGIAFFRFAGANVGKTYTNFGDKPAYADVEAIADEYIQKFTAGRYDAVRVIYMQFISNARQVPRVMQLLPLERPQASAGQAAEADGFNAIYEFQPSPQELLAQLLPLTVKAQLFQAINEAVVSENIGRMVAMKAATDNAAKMGRNLRRQYNRARQSQITTELTEIISGAAALE